MCCICGGGNTQADEPVDPVDDGTTGGGAGVCVDTNVGPNGETLADDW